MENNSSRRWLQALGFIVGLALFALAFHSVRLQEVWLVLIKSFNVYLLLCVVAWILNTMLQSWRWHLMLRAFKDISFIRTLKLFTLYRWSNFILPFRAGEGVRVVSASKMFNIPMPFVMATSVNERLLNLAFLAVLAFILNFLLPILKPYRWALLGLITLLAAGTVLLIWRRREFARQVSKPEVNSPAPKSSSKVRFRSFLSTFAQGLGILGKPSILWGSLISTWAFVGCIWFAVFLLQQNFHPPQPAVSAMTIIVFTNIASLLPLAPANLGTFEWGCIFALSLFGIPKGEALAFSLALQGVRAVSVLLLGLSSWGLGLIFEENNQIIRRS